MKRVNLHNFYTLGQALYTLATITPKKLSPTEFLTLDHAADLLEMIAQDKLLPFPVSRGSAEKLIKKIRKVAPDLTDIVDRLKLFERWGNPEDGDEQVHEMWFDDIHEALKEFETVFASEVPLLGTYFVEQKGIYSTRSLIEDAEKTFSDQVRASIPDHAMADIKQAGMCLAFDLPTAAGFHILRAVEIVMHRYYEVVSGGGPKDRLNSWGDYIAALKGNKGEERVISVLDQIRRTYRNPIMHPAEVLSGDESLSLFGIAQAAIYATVCAIEEAPKRISTGKQGAA